jgi:outer membrane protein OmpA-like peptidoglycan-associated protein
MPNYKYLYLATLLFTLSSTAQVQTNDSLIFTFHFDFNSSTILEKDSKAFASIIKANKQYSLYAHTDSVGTVNYNTDLSKKRLLSVAQYLKTTFKINTQNNQFFGEEKTTALGDAYDRRVEVYSRSKEDKVLEKISFNHIFFVPSTAIIQNTSLPYLEEVYQKVKSIKLHTVEIRGHINWPVRFVNDTIPNYRKPLSEQRAKAVYDYLISKGIPATRLQYKGMYNWEMLYPNPKNDYEQQQNMRVEMVVLEDK